MRVAIVCSWLNQYGGAERVLEVLHALYPTAPVYTAMYDPRACPPEYRTWDIRTSFLQRLPLVTRKHQWFLPLYPLAFEQFDLSGYDLVINNSSAFSYGIITRPETCHLCYCLTPARFLWLFPDYAAREGFGRLARLVLPLFLNYLRTWDFLAAQRVDYFVAISQAVAARIRKFYRRPVLAVLHPPVPVERFRLAAPEDIGDFFLIVSRLVPYKRIDLAIAACNHLRRRLKIVGDGRDRPRLERLAGPTIEFLGRQPDSVVRDLLARCQALLFPGEEDFGLVPLEAQAAGRPVIAYGRGGALETIVPGETGLFFAEPTAEALAAVLADFQPRHFDPRRIRQHAMAFDVGRFQERFRALVTEAYARHRAGLTGRSAEWSTAPVAGG